MPTVMMICKMYKPEPSSIDAVVHPYLKRETNSCDEDVGSACPLLLTL